MSNLDRVAKAIYKTHWHELPNYRYPPVWEATSEEVRDWVREQAQSAIDELESLGQQKC